MQSKEFFDFLKDNNLEDIDPEPYKKAVKECLHFDKEKVLIITDKGINNNFVAPKVAASYYLAFKELGTTPYLITTKIKQRKEPADDYIIETLENLHSNSIIVLCVSKRMGSMKELGESFRGFCRENKHRFVSSTNLGGLENDNYKDLVNSIDLNYKELREKANKIKEILDFGSEAHITTENGTDLYYNIKGKKAITNSGEYFMPGQGGNLPVGEVYIPPKWKNVEGTVVIDGSSTIKEGTQIIREPIRLEVKKDVVTNIEGGIEAKRLKETLEWAEDKAKYPWGIRRLGELGIGLNPKARIIGATVVDEKTLGTAHIALGSNHWFGGTIYAITHLDQVFKNPKIEIDDKLLKI